MTERTAYERAIKRLRDAAWRHTRAHEELDAAQKELVESAHALDLLEQSQWGADGVREDETK